MPVGKTVVRDERLHVLRDSVPVEIHRFDHRLNQAVGGHEALCGRVDVVQVASSRRVIEHGAVAYAEGADVVGPSLDPRPAVVVAAQLCQRVRVSRRRRR